MGRSCRRVIHLRIETRQWLSEWSLSILVTSTIQVTGEFAPMLRNVSLERHVLVRTNVPQVMCRITRRIQRVETACQARGLFQINDAMLSDARCAIPRLTFGMKAHALNVRLFHGCYLCSCSLRYVLEV